MFEGVKKRANIILLGNRLRNGMITLLLLKSYSGCLVKNPVQRLNKTCSQIWAKSEVCQGKANWNPIEKKNGLKLCDQFKLIKIICILQVNN